MKRDQTRREAWRDLCADLRDDDGIDPRRREASGEPSNEARVAGRLCSEVRRILQLALQGCADALLRDLFVSDVAPAPDLSRLQVTLTVPAEDRAAFAQHTAAIARGTVFLRAQVVRAINRKRAPELVFVLLPEAEVKP